MLPLPRRRNKLFSLFASLVFLSPMSLVAKDNNHNDAFMPGEPNEVQIMKDVRHQLLMLPYYGVFDDIAFKVEGGTVTLMGAVTRPTLKSDAEGVAKRVKGVTNVVNQIEVLPLSPNDDQIRRAEYRVIYGDPALSDRYGYRALPSIHTLVKNGNVQLEGSVANKFDYNLINVRSKGVPGAFGVVNDLQVESDQPK